MFKRKSFSLNQIQNSLQLRVGDGNEFLVLTKKVFHPKAPEESTCMFDQICQYLFRSF